MIDLASKIHCICQKYDSYPEQCRDQYTITEQGKSVRLLPGSGELVMAIIMDGCVIQDNHTKCDALFLYHRGNKKYSFLVELKGAAELEKAFYQLSYTRLERIEYREIIEKFNAVDGLRTIEKFVIVSNGMLSKPAIEKLENRYGIRVRKIPGYNGFGGPC